MTTNDGRATFEAGELADELSREIDDTSKRLRAEMRHREFAPIDCPCEACVADRKRVPGDVSEWIVGGTNMSPSLFAAKPKRGLDEWAPTSPSFIGVDRSAYAARFDPERPAYRAPLRERVGAYLDGVWRAVTGWRQT